MNTERAYQFGYDCGLNGATLTNSAFGIFSTPENTREWERGKREGEAIKNSHPNPKGSK